MINEKLLLTNNGCSSFDPVDSGVLEGLFKKDSLGGEEKLMLAVLENAVEYFQKYVLAENEKRLFQEAEDWILEKNSDWLYSFENVCEVLRLYPDYMRQGLLCWKEEKLKAPSIGTRQIGRPKLVKRDARHTSVRRAKTSRVRGTK
jgi:hypothetical protein